MDDFITNEILAYWHNTGGIDQASINLRTLFTSSDERVNFVKRFQAFEESDPAVAKIMRIDGDFLRYTTEAIIPEFASQKTAIMLIFGNPAPHSVAKGEMFSSEQNGREHRIWKVLSNVQLIDFDLTNQPHSRMQKLLKGYYNSRFHIYMLPFFSLPSTTSDQRWSGVAGLRRLFGSKAFSKIENAERERIKQLMKTCLPDGGIALCFQSTAYNCLVNSEKTEFKLANAYESKLITEIEGRVIVAGSMPTRFLIGRRAQAALQKTIEIAEKSYANLR